MIDHRERADAWCEWHNSYRQQVGKLAGQEIGHSVRDFLIHHYAANMPSIIRLPEWGARRWSVAVLREQVGNPEVEVQIGRSSDPDYEIRAPVHRARLPFHDFLDRMEHGVDNDVYMTANNAAGNRSALEPLVDDMMPLPAFLSNEPRTAMLWLGGRTLTPLHHDLTNNLMCQIFGTKQVRMVSPLQTPLLGERIHVHTKIGWLEDDDALHRGISPLDAFLKPGDALFLPLGWWHCVRTMEVSCTAVFTNFVFNNSWSAGFPS